MAFVVSLMCIAGLVGKTTYPLKKSTLHIFDDEGVAACELLNKQTNKRRVGPGLNPVDCSEDAILTTTLWRFPTNTDAIKFIEVNIDLYVCYRQIPEYC